MSGKGSEKLGGEVDGDICLERWRPADSAELSRLIEADREEISRREPWRAPAFFTPAGQTERAEFISARGEAGECLHYVIRAGGVGRHGWP